MADGPNVTADLLIEVCEVRGVLFRNDHGMPLVHRANGHKSENCFVFVVRAYRTLTGNNFAENAFFFGRQIGTQFDSVHQDDRRAHCFPGQ